MGVYLNGSQPYTQYKKMVDNPYFVDKSMILTEIIPLIGHTLDYLCITRPRRFGKTVMANMIGAFLSKGVDSRDIFGQLAIADTDFYESHINRHDVIYISLNKLPKRCRTYDEYIAQIEDVLIQDLKEGYPHVEIDESEAVWDILTKIYTADNSVRFVFVLDEWDFIFRCDFVTEQDEREYIRYLSNLLKDSAYISMVYMTGILPIAKYSSGSELNMFLEYTMVTEERFSDCFGFTETEVDDLYGKFLVKNETPKVTRDGLRIWYGGYHTMSGECVYNPRSVVASLSNNNLGNYWTSSGPYDEIFYYIKKNVADVRYDLMLMAAGEAVPANVREYAATSMNLQTKDEIFSAMVVYGFLSYEKGKVSIPNKELMDRFADMLRKESSLGCESSGQGIRA